MALFGFIIHRLYNYEPLTPLRMLRASVFGRLVCVRGTVVRVSSIRPLCTRMAFRCLGCSHTQSLPLQHGKYAMPTKVCKHTHTDPPVSSICTYSLSVISYRFSSQFSMYTIWTVCIFYHLVYPTWVSQSFFHTLSKFSPHSNCGLADHQVSVPY